MNLEINKQRLIDTIKDHEGFVPTVYKDSLDIDTIGYGFKVDESLEKYGITKDKLYITAISKQEADKILNDKVEDIIQNCKQFNWWSNLPGVIKEVWIEFIYNVGFTTMLKFEKTINYLKEKNYKEAANEMLRSRWAKQVGKRAKYMTNIIYQAGNNL